MLWEVLIKILIFIIRVLIFIGDSVIFVAKILAKITKFVIKHLILNLLFLKLKTQLKITSLKLKLNEIFKNVLFLIQNLEKEFLIYLKSLKLNWCQTIIRQTQRSFAEFTQMIIEVPAVTGREILGKAKIIITKFVKNLKLNKKNVKKRHKAKPVTLYYRSSSLKQQFKYFFFGVSFSLIFFFTPLLAIIFIQDLPNPKRLTVGQNALTTKIYDRNGFLLYQIYANHNRTIVSLSEMPLNLRNATIAIEDKDFYKHPGFDVLAIARSIYVNLSGKSLQGGSTITQQLIKSTLLNPETNISRKVKEIALAFWAERLYSKDQILEMYFNNVPYGGTTWGIETASQTYFGKSVKDLSLSESAFLAGIPKAPTIYSPYGMYPDLWKKRQKDVLERMVVLGYIKKEEKQKALQEEIHFKPPQTPIYAPHFVMYIKDLLIKNYGISMVEKGGLIVKTSLDLKTQEMAQNIVSDEVSKNAYLNLTNGASVITNPKTGDILAMVGSKDFSESSSGSYNVALAKRQPGSSIKVVTYSLALNKGFTAATILDDSPITYHIPGTTPYSPVNYDGKFHGKVPLRLALANSFNITAVKTLNQVGIESMVDLGKKMGIKSWKGPENYGLSITLGAAEATMLDMSTVYGALANGGLKIDLNPILEITDYAGNILEKKQNPLGTSVLSEEAAFIISDILADNAARSWEFGSNSPLYIPNHRVSVKTGTSDNKRDNWTIGYTPSFVVTVWVGNNDNAPMSQQLASGITGAAPIWNRIMNNLLKDKNDQLIIVPQNIVAKPCNGRTEYFVRGTENSVNCNWTPQPSVSPTPKKD